MLKIATWNVNGLRARAAEVLQFLEREQPDVLCLQEIKAAPEQVPPDLCEVAGYHCYYHGHKGYSGVSLHVKKAAFGQRPAFSHPEFDHETRIVTARVGTSAGEVLLASVYVPNGGKDFEAKMRFLEAMQRFAAEERGRGTKLLLCGDLNVALEERDVHPKLRKLGQIGTRPEEQALLAGTISGGALIDLHRKLHPEDDRLFTWWAPWRNLRERNIGWRIDYVLASEALPVAACEVQREFGSSDHGPLVAQLQVEPVATGQGEAEVEKPPKGAGQLELL